MFLSAVFTKTSLNTLLVLSGLCLNVLCKKNDDEESGDKKDDNSKDMKIDSWKLEVKDKKAIVTAKISNYNKKKVELLGTDSEKPKKDDYTVIAKAEPSKAEKKKGSVTLEFSKAPEESHRYVVLGIEDEKDGKIYSHPMKAAGKNKFEELTDVDLELEKVDEDGNRSKWGTKRILLIVGIASVVLILVLLIIALLSRH